MENKNYYEILGVSMKAVPDEITAAKNTLAKQYHPDANMKNGIDTTAKMQEILEAYLILSDPVKRAEYDRDISGRKSVMQTFDLHNMEETDDNTAPVFVTYWKTANALYDIILEADTLFKEKKQPSRLTQLSMQAIKHVIQLRNASIPERYWHPDIMNWLLFTSYKNRNYTVSYLLTLYDNYARENISAIDKIRLQKRSYQYQHSVKRLVKY